MTDDEIARFLSMLDDAPEDDVRWIARAALLQLQTARAQVRHYKHIPHEWHDLPRRVVDFARKCERRVIVGHYAAADILDAHPRSNDQAFRDGFNAGYAVHRELVNVIHKLMPKKGKKP